jgi:hypothetical protein
MSRKTRHPRTWDLENVTFVDFGDTTEPERSHLDLIQEVKDVAKETRAELETTKALVAQLPIWSPARYAAAEASLLAQILDSESQSPTHHIV